ncbi:MAG: Ig-like domain-containing protein, partial [Candidatus Omnitrophica bacterium]|nr:Ig-like domain-containing protein [Candidatus Omnitrophota bacterium]
MMTYPKIRKKISIKIVAGILTIFFIWYDVAWARDLYFYGESSDSAASQNIADEQRKQEQSNKFSPSYLIEQQKKHEMVIGQKQAAEDDITNLQERLKKKLSDESNDTGWNLRNLRGGGTGLPAKAAAKKNSPAERPVAEAQAVTVKEDESIVIKLKGQGIGNDNTRINFIIVSGPEKGGLELKDPGDPSEYIYTPHTGMTGIDIFTFKVKDESSYSEIALVLINIKPANTKPEAEASSITVTQGTSKVIILSATDEDGDILEYEIVSGVKLDDGGNKIRTGHGMLERDPSVLSQYTYTPDDDYIGDDAFTFRVKDGEGEEDEAVISISVERAENRRPEAAAQDVTLSEDRQERIILSASDADGDPISDYEIAGAPSHGRLELENTGNPSIYVYIPDADYNGGDSFAFRVKDINGNWSDPAAVTLSIEGVNDAPVANAQDLTVAQDGELSVTLGATDVDSPALTYMIVGGPKHGRIIGDGQNVIYVPDEGFTGSDVFTFKASDGEADSESVNIFIDVKDTIAPAIILDASTPSLINTKSLAVSYKVDGIDKTRTFSGLSEGVNSLTITEVDLAGNTQIKNFNVTVDTIAPAITLDASTPSLINAKSLTVSYKADGVDKTKAFS